MVQPYYRPTSSVHKGDSPGQCCHASHLLNHAAPSHFLCSLRPRPARCGDESSLCPAGTETPRAQPGADGMDHPPLLPSLMKT